MLVGKGARQPSFFFFFKDPAPPEIYPLPLHDALPICARAAGTHPKGAALVHCRDASAAGTYRLDQDGGQRERHSRDRLGALRERHAAADQARVGDRKSTRLNSSHGYISYAVFCLKK